eukprot:TRINITY_DN66154_c0_g1_i1.p1 TRINITY_DN66154_c0_g1~~TRINITY_DN66154_c0_g1_i1.p1  ORF type:complete len:646 (+),score=98.79 TRINITY_DN66154_c0_g1_i1:25-1938(+)
MTRSTGLRFVLLVLACFISGLWVVAGQDATTVAPADEEKIKEAKQEAKEASEQHEVVHEDGGKLVVWLAVTMMLAILVSHVFKIGGLDFISESVVVIFFGFLVGLVLPTNGALVGHWSRSDVSVYREGLIDAAILNLFLLPIIIFEAGWSMSHKDFLSQLPYILLFAVFGTLISMMVVGGLIQATCHIHGLCSTRLAFTYAALISAVDPVATLATYTHLNVDPLLNILVFGESVVNDAVAIVLFRVLNDDSIEASGSQMGTRIAQQTCSLLFGSVGLGVALGIVYTVIMRFGGLYEHVPHAILFIFLSSFFTYQFAESIARMSGIVTVLFCGMLMSGFAKYHFSVEGNLFSKFALKQAANMADMVVFLFVGITAVYCDSQGMVFGALIIGFCLLGRAAAVIPLALLTNCTKAILHRRLPEEKQLRLSWRQVFMMWHAGLRGGIALVLVLELGPWVDEIAPRARDKVRNATVVTIVVFLLLFGGSTKLLLTCLDIPMQDKAQPMYHHHGRFWHLMNMLRDRVFFPVLVGGDPQIAGRLREDGSVLRILADLADRESLSEEPARNSSASEILGELSRQASTGTGSSTGKRRRAASRAGMATMFGTQDPIHCASRVFSEDEFDSVDEESDIEDSSGNERA